MHSHFKSFERSKKKQKTPKMHIYWSRAVGYYRRSFHLWSFTHDILKWFNPGAVMFMILCWYIWFYAIFSGFCFNELSFTIPTCSIMKHAKNNYRCDMSLIAIVSMLLTRYGGVRIRFMIQQMCSNFTESSVKDIQGVPQL